MHIRQLLSRYSGAGTQPSANASALSQRVHSLGIEGKKYHGTFTIDGRALWMFSEGIIVESGTLWAYRPGRGLSRSEKRSLEFTCLHAISDERHGELLELLRSDEGQKVPRVTFFASDPETDHGDENFYFETEFRYKDFYHKLNEIVLSVVRPWSAAWKDRTGRAPSVLVPGCASGHLCQALQAIGIRAVGMDRDDRYQAIWSEMGLESMYVGDAARTPFATGCFDAVLALGLGTYQVNTMRETAALLKEWRRLLRQSHFPIRSPSLKARPAERLFIWSGKTPPFLTHRRFLRSSRAALSGFDVRRYSAYIAYQQQADATIGVIFEGDQMRIVQRPASFIADEHFISFLVAYS
jgi:SAM-dependent methyltransferase